RSMENGGYALGNNLGVQAARGEYVLLLNPDTEAYPGAVEAMLRGAQDNPGAAVTPKLLTSDGKINACGSTMHYTGITTCNGIGESPDSYHGVFDVLLLSGAACLMPRSMWDQTGGFDAEFFMYMEDVELSLRLRMRGFRILCAADAIVVHHYDFALNERKFYYLERNRLIMLMKCYQLRTFRKLFFGLLLTELATWSFAMLKGRKYALARLRGYRWILRNARYLARERRREQHARRVSDAALLTQMDRDLKFGQLVWKPVALLLRWGTTPLYKLIHRRGVRAALEPSSTKKGGAGA
ncbi:MAG: glycosyltransferase family 2 protein, partial [Bacilli bacterium]